VEVETEECDILALSKLSLHPVILPLFERRQGLLEKKTALLEEQQQWDAIAQDFQRVNALELAEEQPEVFCKWKELKGQLQDYEDQLTLVETGLYELDQRIDEGMAEVREEVQRDIDSRFVGTIRTMVAGLQALVETNQQLHTLENCQHRFFSTGNLQLYSPSLEVWLYRLQRKLALLAPK
jgi:hypothetical protein